MLLPGAIAVTYVNPEKTYVQNTRPDPDALTTSSLLKCNTRSQAKFVCQPSTTL